MKQRDFMFQVATWGGAAALYFAWKQYRTIYHAKSELAKIEQERREEEEKRRE